MRIRNSRNDPFDFCADCAPPLAEAEERFADVGEGPDGRKNCFVYDDEHPPYEDGPVDMYSCYECGVPLGELD